MKVIIKQCDYQSQTDIQHPYFPVYISKILYKVCAEFIKGNYTNHFHVA